MLEIRVFVAMANSLLKILKGKGLKTVINGNEVEMDGPGWEVEGKGNGGNSALFNLKDTAIFIRFTKLIIMVEVVGNFYWIKYWLSQFLISFFH